MARKRISEHKAKTLLYRELKNQYTGILVDDTNPFTADLDSKKRYVVKVDQGIKGRFKKGLVLLNQSAKEVPNALQTLRDKGFNQYIIEEQQTYDTNDEQYLSIERVREGYRVLYSKQGGVNVENKERPVERFIISTPNDINQVATKTGVSKTFLQTLIDAFDTYYFSFLEINPFVLHDTSYLLLDTAAEVDSTAEFFVNGAWDENDYTNPSNKKKTEEEIAVQKLAAKSQAAFSLEVLNPDGNIFMMLSGGGASIVLADEVHNQGYGKELANYGEYSGNPKAEETHIYAKQIISLLLKSDAKKKVLIIAGGVANFTDVRVTFKGLIQALGEHVQDLQKQNIKVYVRRGGPYQEEGLTNMKHFLEKNDLLGNVSGPEMILTDIVTESLKQLKPMSS